MGSKVVNEGLMNPMFSVEHQENVEEEEINVKKFLRGEVADFKVVRDKKLKGQLELREELYRKCAKAAAKADKWLMPSEGGFLEPEGIEKTWRIRQEAIGPEVDILSKKNQYDIVFPELGPYTLDFSMNGRYMVAAGEKGHLALMDLKKMDIIKEFQVRETVRDVVFLHNEKLFAAAQTKYVYMYNDSGTEMHCLKEHGAVSRLQFLRKQFLLTSINKIGQLNFQDITTGKMISNFRTGLGPLGRSVSDTMQVNRFNNEVAVGHSKGEVSMWKPTSAVPIYSRPCHMEYPVTAIAFHSNGHLMATAGMDKKIKLWDLRKHEVLQTLPGHANSLDFSQKGMLSAASGSYVQVFKDVFSTYVNHSMPKGYQTKKLLFRPYEDVLAIGHSMGWSSILVPGSGEPNFDSWVANPFETRKQRNEKEVRALLDKLPPETIMMDPTTIGCVNPTRKRGMPSQQERDAEMKAAVKGAKNLSFKKKTKGRSKPSKMAKKKQQAIIIAKKPFLEQQTKDEKDLLSKKKRKRIGEEIRLPKTFRRFSEAIG
ncbi:hypothetical protein ACJIZ3_006320 [Penstemon smallii]|uniref:BING4 C-terminal domain-containing protein n=1 Tax=Penstemon smallii TaxID=265156 RepID=A0ABD3S7D6_9LAMI